MPAIPNSLWKEIRTCIEETVEIVKGPAKVAGGVGKLTWKIADGFGFVEFYNHKNQVTHSVDFTADEKAHLAAGGTVIIVHGCGKEAHITPKNPFSR